MRIRKKWQLIENATTTTPPNHVVGRKGTKDTMCLGKNSAPQIPTFSSKFLDVSVCPSLLPNVSLLAAPETIDRAPLGPLGHAKSFNDNNTPSRTLNHYLRQTTRVIQKHQQSHCTKREGYLRIPEFVFIPFFFQNFSKRKKRDCGHLPRLNEKGWTDNTQAVLEWP